ncbi:MULTISPECIES: prolipoprotein diacylglyceryl transferase family protein [unclassified Streptomyces]|uniref:prolipoprotein diacylglyceryl transferase family protein n=1 Tax=unclassified Streptomyces TaxID=2593676 RepID=UPI002E28881B|nr:prolipoprotein diacylglyceryl transferase family protein [Streptomyces sp. NBC_01439]
MSAPLRRPGIQDADPPSRTSRWLDGLAAAPGAPFGCDGPPYLVCGLAGIGAGTATLAALFAARGPATSALVVAVVASAAAFVLMGLAQKALLGRERHVLLENVLLVLAVNGIVAHLLGEPVRTVLDCLVVALGVVTAAGRWGCLLHGCCHGRPSRFGIRYTRGLHGDDPLAGVRLFPVQLLDGAALLAVTALATPFALGAAAPGTAVLFWLTAYAIVRFVIEFARGDARARRIGPLTGAQWTSLLIVVGRIGYEQAQLPATDPKAVLAAACALTVCAGAWLARPVWLELGPPEPTDAEIDVWQRMLVALERAATDNEGGSQVGWSLRTHLVSLLLTVRACGAEFLYVCTLRGADVELLPAAGLFVQRLGEHRVLRAAHRRDGSLVITLLVRAGSPSGSTPRDDPGLVHLRALAASREVVAALSGHLPVDRSTGNVAVTVGPDHERHGSI